MKKNTKWFVGCGIACLILMLLSSWYAVTYNDSRLVAPMDFGSYVFQARDLPMILSISLTLVYGVTLLIWLFYSIGKSRKELAETNTIRRLNPKLGFLGLLGFLGFAGFWTYPVSGVISPFVFFLFFGFFGFYYEGKMSGTFMDERFRENAVRANVKASNITFTMLFVALAMFSQGRLFGNLDYTLIAIITTLPLVLALRIFLGEYLLYRYDHDDHGEESGA